MMQNFLELWVRCLHTFDKGFNEELSSKLLQILVSGIGRIRPCGERTYEKNLCQNSTLKVLLTAQQCKILYWCFKQFREQAKKRTPTWAHKRLLSTPMWKTVQAFIDTLNHPADNLVYTAYRRRWKNIFPA
jgi:hypothetical protein